MDATILEQLEIQKRIARSFVNLKKLGAAKITKEAVMTRIAALEGNWSTFQANHKTLLPLATREPKQEYFVQDFYLSTEEEYLQVRSLFEAEFNKFETTNAPPEVRRTQQSETGTTIRQIVLPKIDLPTFSGEYHEWSRFSALFTSLVLNNSTLTAAERLHYLLLHLSGDAADFLRDIPLDTSIESVWSKLRDRYQNQRLLVNAQLRILTTIPPMETTSSRELKRLLNTTSNVISALESLNRPLYDESTPVKGDLLVYLTVHRLDPTYLREWETLVGASKVPPSFEQLRSFLETKIQVQDIIEAQESAMSAATARVSTPGPRKSLRSHHLAAHKKRSPEQQCDLCHGDHYILFCKKFVAMTPSDRYSTVTSKHLCTNCLGRHPLADCRSQKRCQRCLGKHHTSLHDAAEMQMRGTTSVSAPRSAHATSATFNDQTVTLLATARVRIHSTHGASEIVRALVDPCSEVSLIAESLVQRLHLPRQSAHLPITGVGDNSTVMCRGKVHFEMTPHSHFKFAYQVDAYVLPKLSTYRPRCHSVRSSWPHLEGLTLADPRYDSSDAIDVLLGADVFGSIIREGLRKGGPMTPIAQCTSLGWILTGSTSTKPEWFESRTNEDVQPCSTMQCSIDTQLLSLLERFWAQEEEPHDLAALSEEDRLCEEHFGRTYERLPSGRFLVRLPFKASPSTLGNTRPNAMRALRSMEAKFRRDSSFQVAYCRFMEEYKSLGHMELSRSSNPSLAHAYLPHHGVFKSTGSSSKLRVVFNGSTQSSTKVSLNDLLHTGPRLQPDLSTILSRWRRHKYALCADIEKMYRQILLHEDDRGFQRILWRGHDDTPIQEYCLNTVTYGLSCAPYLALRTLKQLAHEESSRFPTGSRILSTSTYVDDILTGAHNVDELKAVQRELDEICMAGGFKLAKWSSNVPNFVTKKEAVPLPPDILAACDTGVLGLRWNTDTDSLAVNVELQVFSGRLTKRIVLGLISQIFDPLGWLAPFTSAAKIFLQSLWLLAIDWDEELPAASRTTWNSLINGCDHLGRLQIPRWLGVSDENLAVDIHGFCDASERAYAAVIYLRVASGVRHSQVTLLTAKTKVSPLKQVSLPRLELCGAAILTKLASHVLKTIDLPIERIHLWTDSTVTLGWIQGHPSRWKTYVANRVSQIQTLLPQARWHHVPGTQNPADCASRGIGAAQLVAHPLWWNGPTWLSKGEADWPIGFTPSDCEVELEARPCFHRNIPTAATDVWELAYRYSSWTRLLRITAWCQRWRTSPKSNENSSLLTGILTPSDLQKAQEFWISSIQRANYSSEIHALRAGKALNSKSSLITLRPFLDDRGLLRVGGRLTHSALLYDAKHPLIIPRASPISPLLIKHCHLKQLHGGVQMTLSTLRQQFWMPQGRSEVKKYIHQCLSCLKWRARSCTQLMGDLPERRVTPTRPFCHSGLDYAGPLSLKIHHGRGYKTYKGFIAIFVCHATRAVHIELVSDYSASAFLAAFKRFVSRRGICSSITSDCGTNFVGADAELRRLFRAASSASKDIAAAVAQDGTKWIFNPPGAPHMNGLVEAAVKSTKHHLRRVVGDKLLTYEEMTTFLTQVEACLNSRPLAALNDDPEDFNVITPGHFLVGAPLNVLPEPDLAEVPCNHLSRWQKLRQMTDHFWTRWSQEYLQSLQPRRKWATSQENIAVGDLCLIRAETTLPSKWPLGRVIRVFPGADGQVRVVELRTQHSTLKRPITKLIRIPFSKSSLTPSNY